MNRRHLVLVGVAMFAGLAGMLAFSLFANRIRMDQLEAPGGPALSKDVADQVKAMMLLSEQHTGGAGKQANVKIASKTGTAEHGTDPKNTPPHAWYVAFAPADNPQIAVCVVVENGGDRGLAATGSSVAAGVGRATINAYLAGGG